MTLIESLYRDSLLKWLRSKRDHPYDNMPEPKLPAADRFGTHFDLAPTTWLDRAYWTAVRREVIRDWNRKQ